MEELKPNSHKYREENDAEGFAKLAEVAKAKIA